MEQLILNEGANCTVCIYGTFEAIVGIRLIQTVMVAKEKPSHVMYSIYAGLLYLNIYNRSPFCIVNV